MQNLKYTIYRSFKQNDKILIEKKRKEKRAALLLRCRKGLFLEVRVLHCLFRCDPLRRIHRKQFLELGK